MKKKQARQRNAASPKKSSGSKKNKQKKLWLLGLAGATVAGIGYFSWRYYKKAQKQNSQSGDTAPVLPWPVTPPTTPVRDEPTPIYLPNPYKPPPKVNATKPNGDAFPLKKGSRGEKVRAFQQALMDTYGKQVLPRYGADGGFGSETAAALKKLKLPATIDETTFNIMVKAGGGKGGLAKTLIDAATKKDFAAAIKALKQIGSTEQYSEVSNEFKTMRIGGGVRQTLVNGMLNTFADEAQKRAIRMEFQRMGLQYDGNKWTLSGFDGLPIVTVVAATVWLNSKESVRVPARTVLGNEITRRLDYTLFESKGRHFLVQTNQVAYL